MVDDTTRMASRAYATGLAFAVFTISAIRLTNDDSLMKTGLLGLLLAATITTISNHTPRRAKSSNQ